MKGQKTLFDIQEVPETPQGLKVLDKSGQNVKLSWQGPYNGNSNLTRYLIEHKPVKGTWQNDIERVMVGGEDTIAGVYSLRPATAYHFRIVAENAIGSSGPSDTITVETSEEAPSGINFVSISYWVIHLSQPLDN